MKISKTRAGAALGVLGLGATLAVCSSSSSTTPAAASTRPQAAASSPCYVASTGAVAYFALDRLTLKR